MLNLSHKRKLAEELNASYCASEVCNAYVACIKKTFRKSARAFIGKGSKTEANAVKFIKLTRDLNVSTERLVKEALDFFEPDFCQKVCKKDFPPITFILSEKTQGKLAVQNKPKIEVSHSNIKELADQYIDVLRAMGKEMAIEAVIGGWPEGSKRVRKELLRRLEND